MPRPDHSKLTPEQIKADQDARESRRAELRQAALAAKAEQAKAGGHDPDKHDGRSVEELEKLSYELQAREAPKAERLAARVALDRALARQNLDAKLAGLSDDERSVLVRAETLRAKTNARPA
jgi:hypothetical protein